jgi:hypothetical protein
MIDGIHELVDDVAKIGYRRCEANAKRRLMKMCEEVGELSEAILNVTCVVNYKKKTWADIREEAVDCLIVMLDVALTPIADTKHSPMSLLPQIIDGGRRPDITIEHFPDCVLEISRATCRAADALNNGEDMIFYGTLSHGLAAVASICFAPMDLSEDEAATAVFEIVKRKLTKWTNALRDIEEAQNHEAL